MATSLTPNSIVAITNGADNINPVVQVVDVRQIGSAQASERFRMVISDGEHLQQAMLATQLNTFVTSGEVRKGSIIQLSECICNNINNRRIVIILGMQVLNVHCEIIGDPKFLDSNNQHQQKASMPMQQAPQSIQNQPLPQAQPPHSYGSSYSSAVRPTGGMNSAPQSVTSGASGLSTVSSTGTFSMSSKVKPQPGLGNPMQNVSNTGGIGAGTGPRGLNPQPSAYGRPGSGISHQPPPMYGNRGPIARNEAPARIVPITALNPYQGRWTIKARVTSKGDVRRFNNAKGDGKVFSFDLLDSEGGEIRVTCFNSVVDQFFDRIEAGRVYLISKGSLKPAQKTFNHLNNEWEIFLDSASSVELCLGEDNTIPKLQFNFRPISDIEQMENNAMVDVIGVVMSINPSSTIMRKNGTETLRRTLQLKDMSSCSVELTMWGAFCSKEGQELQELCDAGYFPVLAIKSGRISDFGGKSVGTISATHLLINPDFPEAQRLRNWFDTEGKSTTSQFLTKESMGPNRLDQRKTVSQIKDEGLGRSEKPDWITVKATISFLKVDNFCYTACPLVVNGDRQCNKKVSNNGDGTWHCERCDRSFNECDYRYLLQAQVQDHTGVTWITAFQEAGEQIMGVTAKELYMWKHVEENEEKFNEAIRKVLFNQYLFKLKVKEETYSDEQRVKSVAVKVDKIDFSSESKTLLDLIGKLSRGEPINPPVMANPNMGTHAGPGYSSYSDNVVGNNSSYGFGGSGGFGGNQDSGYFGSSGGYGARSGGISGMNSGGVSGMNSSGISGMNSGGVSGMNTSGISGMNASTSTCYRCNKPGHFARDCPNTASGYGSSGAGAGFGNSGTGGSSTSCYKCGQPGHWARDCPATAGIPSAYGTASQGMRGSYGGAY